MSREKTPSVIDWEGIVREHAEAVWWTVYRIVNHHADAADCYQETFLAAIELADRQPVENWGALLRRIATRRAIDCLRQRTCSRERMQDVAGVPEEPAGRESPVDHARSAELMQRVRDGLTQIPSKQAEVFWLRSIEGLTYREIAHELGLPENEVGVLLHRARARLQRTLDSDEAGDKVAR